MRLMIAVTALVGIALLAFPDRGAPPAKPVSLRLALGSLDMAARLGPAGVSLQLRLGSGD